MNNTDSPNPIDDILDSRGLSIFMLILTLVILGFLITNVVYFKRIANDPSTSASNAKAAKNLGWINIVLAVALGIVVIYYLFKSFTNKQTRNILYAEAGQQVASVQNAIPTLSGPAIAVVNYNVKNISIFNIFIYCFRSNVLYKTYRCLLYPHWISKHRYCCLYT